LAPGAINGVDPANLTLDVPREARIVFAGGDAAFQNVLGAFHVAPDGSFVEIRIVLAPLPESLDGPPVSLGIVPAGALLGLFLVSDGGPEILPLQGSGTFAFRDGEGEPYRLGADGPPLLVHIAPDGTTTPILADVFHTVDPTPDQPLLNPLNPGGRQQVISGFAEADGVLRIVFDDIRLDDPRSDGDFNDAVLGLAFGTVATQIFSPVAIGLGLRITDQDGVALAAAAVAIAGGRQAFDRLFLDPDLFPVDAQGAIGATGLRLVEDGAGGRLAIEGDAAAEVYQTILQAVRFTSEGPAGVGVEGTRRIEFEVVDQEGRRSEPADLRLEVVAPIRGSDADDVLSGTDADDVLSGGAGRDQLFGGAGDDILIGGPDGDILVGGPGADTFLYASLADRLDVIRDFDAFEGDRIDLSLLLDGVDLAAGPLDTFLRLESGSLGPDGQSFALDPAGPDRRLSVDLDGPGAAFAPVSLLILESPQGATSVEAMVAEGSIVL
jgi:hypothetical protein